MTATVEVDNDGMASDRASKLPVIDCDIHETMPSPKVLLPYLDEVWHQYTPTFEPLPYDLGPLVGHGQRLDSWPADYGYPEGPPGSSYPLVRDQLLDPFNYAFGVLTGLFFPATTRAQFEYTTAATSAYNDWLDAEWLGLDERLYGSIQIPYYDPEASAAEIERVASRRKLLQVMLPLVSRQPGARQYRPIFEAAARHDLVIAIHQSNVTQTAIGYPPYYIEWHVGFCQHFMAYVTNMIFSGLFDEFPNLHVVVLEGDFSWVPFLRLRMDSQYKAGRTELPWLQRKPSEYLRDHFFFGTQPMPEPETSQELIELIEAAGQDNLVYASDYPHWDYDPEDKVLPIKTVGADLRNKLVNQNAIRLYEARLARVGDLARIQPDARLRV